MRKSTQQKIFDGIKRTYNKIAKDFSLTRQQSWKEFHIFDKYLRNGDKLLDLGCGNGRLLNSLERRNIEYIGVDNSEELLKQARILHPENKFILGDFMEIPVPKESQDIVACIAAFHHIPSKKSRHKAMKNIYKTMKKDGILIITVWNLWQRKYFKYLVKAFIKWLTSLGNYHKFDTFIPWGNEKEPRYYHAFLPYEMKGYFKKAGLTLLEYELTKGDKATSLFKAYNQVYICKK